MDLRGVVQRRMPALCALGAVGWACSSTDVTYYGPPGGLTGKSLPSPRAAASSASSGGSGSGSGSSGVVSGSSGAQGSSSSSGGRMDAGTADAGSGACAVSWATQIFPSTTATGAWKCAEATSCHGGLQAPKMTSDPSATYKTLSTYVMQNAPQPLPYILPGSTDPTKSGLVCNVSGSNCGPQMPLAGVVTATAALTPQEITMVTTWVACGAPNN